MAEPGNNRQRPKTRRRIAVLLGTGSSCRRVLQALQPLLEREEEADLIGVFVEESDLQAAAELPFVKELCWLTSSVRELHTVDVTRETARRLREARMEVERAAARAGASHSFHSTRGPALGLLRETVLSADVTIFEPVRVGALALLQGSAQPAPSLGRIVLAIDSATPDVNALKVTRELARRRADRTGVLLSPVAAAEPAEIQPALNSALPAGRRLIERLPDDTVPSLIAATRRLGAACLVLSAGSTVLEDDALRLLREGLNCPVVVVRAQGFDPGSGD